MMPPHIRAEFLKNCVTKDPAIIRDLQRADKEREAAAKIIVTDPTQIIRDISKIKAMDMLTAKDPGVAFTTKDDGSVACWTKDDGIFEYWCSMKAAKEREAGGAEAEDASNAPPTAAAAPLEASIAAAPPTNQHAVMGPFVPRSALTDDTVLMCKDCEGPVEPSGKGVRMTSKQKNTYQCGRCNSACTVLSYALGGWPTEEFKRWDPETKKNFFRQGLKGSDLKRNYAETCAKKRIELRSHCDAGEMRPLQYWEHLGYDVERLKTFTPKEDQLYTAQLGWQFRVNVNKKNTETEVEREVQDILCKMAKKRGKDNGKRGKDKAKLEASSGMASSDSPVKKRKASNVTYTPEKKRKSEEQKQDKDLTGTPLGCD